MIMLTSHVLLKTLCDVLAFNYKNFFWSSIAGENFLQKSFASCVTSATKHKYLVVTLTNMLFRQTSNQVSIKDI